MLEHNTTMKHTRTLFTALLLVSLSAFTLHPTAPTSKEGDAAAQRAQDNTFAELAKLPFSFMLRGKSSDELFREWKRTDLTRELDAQRRSARAHGGMRLRAFKCGLSR
jgi:hypothetical protein